MSQRITKELARDAMQMAIDQRTNFAGVIMHTDRGNQYCSKRFQAILKASKIRSSMSKNVFVTITRAQKASSTQ